MVRGTGKVLMLLLAGSSGVSLGAALPIGKAGAAAVE